MLQYFNKNYYRVETRKCLNKNGQLEKTVKIASAIWSGNQLATKTSERGLKW